MKRWWRAKSRKSAGSGPSLRSGESTSPCRSGEPTACSDRSGGRAPSASAAPDREGEDERMQRRRREGGGPSSGRSGERASSAAPDREGGVERMQHRGSKARDGLPSPGEETSISPKRRHKKQRRCSHGNVQAALKAYAEEESNVSIVWSHVNEQAALKAYAEEEGNAPAALKEPEEESIKQEHDATMQKGFLDDAGLMMDQTALRTSHNSSWSGDAQEEAPIDWEKTSLRPKMDNKSKSCSEDCGKIAQDEGEHHNKKFSSVVENGHSDEIGVHAIEDHKQEQGREVRNVQALLDIDNHTIREKIYDCLSQLNYDPPDDPFYWSEYEPEQLIELHQRLALYRVRGYDYELSADRKLAELDDATLAQQYPPSILYDEGYFEHYEESLEWYFDPELCKYAGYEDYQRLVLCNYGEYRDWDCYKSTLHTYEKDLAYIQYCEAIENGTKWIVDYHVGSSIPWERVENVAYLQSLKVAARFPNVSPTLVISGFQEHMLSVVFDFWNNGLDRVYFEIWKRVAKLKMDFTEALSEIHREEMFPFRSFEFKQELENPTQFRSMKAKYDAYVACIGDLVSDDEALPLIAEAVKKMSPKSKNYANYVNKKLEIAKAIHLITKRDRNWYRFSNTKWSLSWKPQLGFNTLQ